MGICVCRFHERPSKPARLDRYNLPFPKFWSYSIAGVNQAILPPPSTNSSEVELSSPGPATGPLPEAPAAAFGPSFPPGVLAEAPGPAAAAQNTAFLEYLGPWQQCSTSCGMGVQERSLLCYGDEGYTLTELPSCDAQTATTWRTCRCSLLPAVSVICKGQDQEDSNACFHISTQGLLSAGHVASS